MALQSGQYDIDDLVEKLPFSKRTIERKIPEWNIKVERSGNKRIFTLTDEDANFINSVIANNEKWHCKDSDLALSGIVRSDDAKREDFHQKEILITELSGRLEKSEALAEAERKANNVILEAKQKEVDSLKMALASMEKTTQALQASMILLERDNKRIAEQLTPSIPMIMSSQKPQAFWSRLKAVFTG
jgi:hypothetical protein